MERLKNEKKDFVKENFGIDVENSNVNKYYVEDKNINVDCFSYRGVAGRFQEPSGLHTNSKTIVTSVEVLDSKPFFTITLEDGTEHDICMFDMFGFKLPLYKEGDREYNTHNFEVISGDIEKNVVRIDAYKILFHLFKTKYDSINIFTLDDLKNIIAKMNLRKCLSYYYKSLCPSVAESDDVTENESIAMDISDDEINRFIDDLFVDYQKIEDKYDLDKNGVFILTKDGFKRVIDCKLKCEETKEITKNGVSIKINFLFKNVKLNCNEPYYIIDDIVNMTNEDV